MTIGGNQSTSNGFEIQHPTIRDENLLAWPNVTYSKNGNDRFGGIAIVNVWSWRQEYERWGQSYAEKLTARSNLRVWRATVINKAGDVAVVEGVNGKAAYGVHLRYDRSKVAHSASNAFASSSTIVDDWTTSLNQPGRDPMS
jgi:hypothetical protein